MNILLIEDDENLHVAIRDYLRDHRYRVTACRTIAEAGAVLARLPDRSVAPDAIVADSDALGFYMKARARFPDMRWILITPRQQAAEIDGPRAAAVEPSSDGSADRTVSPRPMDFPLPAPASRVGGSRL